jgi:hypothetical protein
MKAGSNLRPASPCPLVNKPLRRIRGLEKKLQTHPHHRAFIEKEMEVQGKLLPRFIYEIQFIFTNGKATAQPGVKIADHEGKFYYVPMNEYRKMIASGDLILN